MKLNMKPAVPAAIVALGLFAAPASAIVFDQTLTGPIVFNPAAGNGTTSPGDGGPLTATLNFGGYLGTPGDLAGETLIAVAIEWSASFDGASGVSITNNAAGQAFVGVSESGTHSITLPSITQSLTVSASNGAGAFIDSGNTEFNALLANEATTDSTTAVAGYLTNFASSDIAATITANFAGTLFSSQPAASIGYDFLINSSQSVTLTYISEAPTVVSAPGALLLLMGGLGLMGARRRSAS